MSDSPQLEIKAYMHCKKCLDELDEEVPAQIAVGWTPVGIQIWCERHELNIIHIDFEGHLHPTRVE